jgi:hypothetical protein
MTKRISVSAMLGTILLAGVTACGGGSSGTTAGGSGGGSGGPSVSIVEPADGATIKAPFQLKVKSSESLGPTQSGQHHVHLFFDGNDKKYEVVESDNLEISTSSKAVAGLTPGRHELDISLRNADHSPAGAETKIMVEVGDSGGSQPPASGGGAGGGGNGY